MDAQIVCFVLLLFCLAGFGVAAPAVDTEGHSSSNKIQNFEEKLSKLRSLLTDITKTSENKHADRTAEPKSKESKMASESQMSREADTRSQKDLKLSGDSTMTAGLAGLQGETLEALELALQTLKNQRLHQNLQRTTDSRNVDMGTFRDEPLPDPSDEKPEHSTQDSEIIKLAKLLTDGDTDRSNTDVDEGYRQPKEGRFGMFRGEALRLVEDKLLDDVEIALENGLTLDEIMQDLERQEDKARARDLLRRLAERIPRHYRD